VFGFTRPCSPWLFREGESECLERGSWLFESGGIETGNRNREGMNAPWRRSEEALGLQPRGQGANVQAVALRTQLVAVQRFHLAFIHRLSVLLTSAIGRPSLLPTATALFYSVDHGTLNAYQ